MPNKIIAAVKAWLRAIEDRRHLAEMPDYLLKDIGLRRDQIDAGGVWREDIAPAAAKVRPSAKVVAIAPAAVARPADKPAAPEKEKHLAA
ncbi:MAG: DUF1127 domain-containing protein [Rhodospirillales bacterium]|nr:DUF1127 domain-containing protein [Rhodospirillales bacterium]